MDYTNYTVEDLASDDSFIQWANRSQQEAVTFWDDFIQQHPEMNLKVAQARTLVLNLRQAESIRHSEDHIESLWEGIENRLAGERETHSHKPKNAFPLAYFVVAVFGLSLASVGAWYVFNPALQESDLLLVGSPSHNADFIEEVNTSGNVLRVHLSDGSAVALENNSRLRYKESFKGDSSRTVYLSGEAFFDVTKDPAQPFMVHTNDVVTRVLGTSFRVKAPDDNADVVVTVKTGKVSVYSVSAQEDGESSQRNAVVLLPNQQVTYIREQDSFGKSLVSEPEIILPSLEADDFAFENTPVKKVFKVLQKAYGIEIIFDEEIMNNCFFTAPLGSEPLFEKLKIICRTIGARYETIDAKVVIISTGC